VAVTVAVVVVAAVAISSSAASAAAASGGAALSTGSSRPQSDGTEQKTSSEESLLSSLQTQVAVFKETIAKEQFSAVSESSGISMEENGRIIGSLFAHKTVDSITNSFTQSPSLVSELKDLGISSQYPAPKWLQTGSESFLMPHSSTDLAFSTSYANSCSDFSNLNALTYQVRGDLALSSEYYNQAVDDFGKAIELEPTHSSSYLGRGLANFELGNYKESIIDYNEYVSQTKEPFSATDFSIGFAKGLPKGIYDSGEGILLFVTDLASHPIQTSKKVYDSLSALSHLAKSGEWELIGEALSPELHRLVSQWDTLSAAEKGELSGYAFGKHGTDIFLPGAAVKAVAKGSTAAKELGSICRDLQSAEKLLVLEAVAEASASGTNVTEVVTSAKKAIEIGEDIGLSTKEIVTLKQSGTLERLTGKGRDFFAGNPELQASYDLFTNAKENLKTYAKKPMPESTIRNLIHENGIPTFEKPVGIPENYLVRITEKGAGMEYFDPINPKTSIRVMPGVPHSPNPRQQVPYVVQTKKGKTFDRWGKEVSSDAPEAHIPLCEFVYKD
jgi:tetratricopeptide (TPR) repeat protein